MVLKELQAKYSKHGSYRGIPVLAAPGWNCEMNCLVPTTLAFTMITPAVNMESGLAEGPVPNSESCQVVKDRGLSCR
jgi:hypothetical protein